MIPANITITFKKTAICLKTMLICKAKYNIDLLIQVFPQNVACKTKNKTFIRLTMKQNCVKIYIEGLITKDKKVLRWTQN